MRYLLVLAMLVVSGCMSQPPIPDYHSEFSRCMGIAEKHNDHAKAQGWPTKSIHEMSTQCDRMYTTLANSYKYTGDGGGVPVVIVVPIQ